MARILTILARGFLFHRPDGEVRSEDPRSRLETARQGLCAWCSMPENKRSRKEWQYHTDFSSLREEFPKLVDETGYGWFSRHFHRAMRFAWSIRIWFGRAMQSPPGRWIGNLTRYGGIRCGSSRPGAVAQHGGGLDAAL